MQGKLTHAGGLVFKEVEGKVSFLITNANGNPKQWILPKGHIEEGENPEFTAIREVIEETGILAMPVKTICDLQFEKSNETVQVRYFLMKYNQDLSSSKEHRAIQWLDKESALDVLSFEDAKKVIEMFDF